MASRSPVLRRASRSDGPQLSEEQNLMLTKSRSHDLGNVENMAVQQPEEHKQSDEPISGQTRKWPASTRYLVLLTAFITSLSFGVTQVPLLYVFRLMVCDAYFHDRANEPSNKNIGLLEAYYGASTLIQNGTSNASDRCSIHPIEASTAVQISILGASTTIFGILNLFWTGALIKRIGVKRTLMIQVFFPAVRLFIQNIGVEVWGSLGIIIVQCSQIVSIIGGPSGYLLALNTFITEVVDHEGRTAALGRLTGAMMFGSASGFLLGGVVAEAFGIKAPFRLTFALFSLATLYAGVCLPYIAPVEDKDDAAAAKQGRMAAMASKFTGPLSVFAPKDFILSDGTIQKQWGAFLLAWGVFLGILATGYLPTLLQLYATDVFGFGTKANGWLIFLYSILRGVFLTFVFPKLIAVGRKWTIRSEEAKQQASSENAETQPLLAGNQDDTASGARGETEQRFTFDLTYTRFSLIADGMLTLLCTFVHEGWQMYLVATILPFAAGTGSAAKGTILQMLGASTSSHERTDALAGVSLVENMARLSTIFVFGVIFAGFASIGHTELIFVINAAVALFGFGVLLFARFPPEGSRKRTREEMDTED